MKTILSLLLCLAFSLSSTAKKVKFAVDMTGQTISANGVHVSGDFQALAGLGADWDPASAILTKEGSSNIYSLIVNLPAFKKYEYRFVNGDQSYEAEFVPDESRVGYEFVDNRWLYVDSLKNDTSFVGAILFGANAPAGLKLLKFKVDLRVTGTISANGVHVGYNLQTTPFSAVETRMYSFVEGIYEIVAYVPAGTCSFIYYNGKQISDAETVPGSCATNAKRSVTVSADTELAGLCFSSCAACVGVGIEENGERTTLDVYPNPVNEKLIIRSSDPQLTSFFISDVTGQKVIESETVDGPVTVDVSQLAAGMYIVNCTNSSGKNITRKLLVN
jgi:hypothetical protein